MRLGLAGTFASRRLLSDGWSPGGAVIAEGSGRKRLYSAAERLYCIYYKLRRESDKAAVVQHLIQFMSAFYGTSEMANLSRMLISEAFRSKAIRERIARVLANTPGIPHAFKEEVQGPSEDLVVLLKRAEGHLREMQSVLQERDLGKYFEAADQILALDPQIRSLAGDSEIATAPTDLLAATLRIDAAVRHEDGDPRNSVAITEGLVARFASSTSPTIQATVAEALIDQSDLQQDLGNYEAAVETLKGVIERFGDSEAPEVHVPVAKAFIKKGTALARLGNVSAAISSVKQVGKRFETGGARALSVQIARGLVKEAELKRGKDDSMAAWRTYGAVDRLFGTDEAPEIRVEVARAMVGKGFIRAGLGDPNAAIKASNEVAERFGDSDAPDVQIQVAEALILKGHQLERLGESDGARAAFDHVVKTFGRSNDPELLMKVANVLSNNTVSESVRRCAQKSLARFDQVVERFFCLGSAPDILVSRSTLLYKAGFRKALGDTEGELVVLDQLIERLGVSEMPVDQTLVSEALARKSELLITIGREDAALQACEEFERTFDDLAAKHRTQLGWQMGRVRVKALLGLKRHAAVMDAFRSTYALFNPADRSMIQGITDCVHELVVAGVLERDIERILLSDREKSDALVPLMTALRQRTGRAVRVPKEVLDVAADIRDYLEGKEQ